MVQNPGSANKPNIIVQILEENKKLSECLLWQMQEDFYNNAGIEAWNQVPFYPTCNAFIGRTYAEMILAFLLDVKDQLNPDEPIYIVEMACGTGGLSFYLVKDLLKRIAHYPSLASLRWVYVMTDFTENNVSAWEKNPKLLPFVEKGVMDFGVFRPEDQREVYLRQSKVTLSRETVKNPIISVANYFFDTIRHDLFRIADKKLLEGRVSFHRELVEGQDSEQTPPTFGDLRKTESFSPVSADYYDDPKLNAILKYYMNAFDNASVLFPISSFKCLSNLQYMSNDRLVLISSDKGFTQAEYMQDHWDQNFAVHGSFSFMVNYHSIGLFFEQQEGTFWSTKERTGCLATVMGIMMPGMDQSRFENSGYYFLERVDNENPINNLYFCQDLLHVVSPQPRQKDAIFKASLSLLKLSNYDPIAFYFMGNNLYSAITELDWSQRESLYHAACVVKDNFYYIRRDFNTLYWVAKMFYGLDRFEECRQTFLESIELFGVDDQALYYIAACNEVLGDSETALLYYRKTLELDPNCELTKSGIQRMLAKLGQGAPTH